MSGIIDSGVVAVNGAGRVFCAHAAGVFLQAGVLILVLLCVDLLLRNRIRATLRYWIWMLVFVKLLLPPGLSVPTGIGYWLGRFVPAPPAVSPQAVETVREPVQVEPAAPAVMSPMPASSPAFAPVEPAAAVEPVTSAGPVAAVVADSEPLTWQGGVFLLWSAGVLVFFGLVIQRWVFVKGLMARAEPAQDDLVDVLDDCRRRMGVRGKLAIRLSPNTFSPAVCGLLHPTVLMPRELLDRLPPESLRAVLIHELAHVRRGDLWVNSLQTLLQIVYFYNPLVWLANAIVRRVREQAVDEMVLVALGAEARSYSTTLIDIAEMAFLRVSPALRLIGVAESRKSLEGRIRHMMTRPIPRSARMGMIGVLVVAATGAILLPMARAAVEPQPRFVANLPGGATVELVGVCNWPASGPVAWRADGSALDKPMYASKHNVRPSADRYGFLFRVTGNDDIDPTWNGIEGSGSWEGSCDVVDEQGNRLEGGIAAVALMKEPPARTALRIGLATGPWRTISTHDGKRMSPGRGRGVLWSQAFEGPSGTYIVASAEQQGARKERIAAVDTGGVVHIAPGAGSVSSGNVDQFTAHFPDLKPGQIKEFQYQVRVCRMIEFRNISLRPGEKTDVQVEVEGPTAASGDANASQPPATAGTSDARANIFVMAPSGTRFNLFDAVIARAEEWAWNRTGRNHSKRAYDEIFDGTNNRTDHDVLVLLFALDREDRVPGGYEDLLPKPWPQIEEQLRQGQTVELSGRARGLAVILLAAPKAEQLTQVIADSRILGDPQSLLGRSGKGCDIALESFGLRPGHIPNTYRAVASGRNRGDAACPRFIVRFHTGDPVVDAQASGAGPLQPRETWDAGSFEFVLKDGVHDLDVVLDPADLVDELDETNNRAGLRVVVKDGQIVEQSTVAAGTGADEPDGAFQTYSVNRNVADFPPGEDFSTPEAAYVTIDRVTTRDPSAWPRVSIARQADRLARSPAEKSSVKPERMKALLNARIREVMIWNMTWAAVMAELPQEPAGGKATEPIDVRYLRLENGRWLNTGNGGFPSMEAARIQFMGQIERMRSFYETMKDPLQYADEIEETAERLFEGLRTADYAKILSHYHDGKWDSDFWKVIPTSGLYTVHTDYPGFVLWCCTHFKDNPIIDIQLGDVFSGDALVEDKTGWPTVPYKLTLKDGTVLAGNLPFYYSMDQGKGEWCGMEGIDWHLWPTR